VKEKEPIKQKERRRQPKLYYNICRTIMAHSFKNIPPRQLTQIVAGRGSPRLAGGKVGIESF
jgi:hypothetical protein